jgi:hypothetical protein
MATDTVAAPALPDDVLEDILCRLPARSLAGSQCVCKAWRDVVGERRLLLRLLLLDESDGNKMEWVLKHRSVVNPDSQQMRYDGPWTIADAYNEYSSIGTYDDVSETEKMKKLHRRMAWDGTRMTMTSSTLQMRTNMIILGSVLFSLDFIRTRK